MIVVLGGGWCVLGGELCCGGDFGIDVDGDGGFFAELLCCDLLECCKEVSGDEVRDEACGDGDLEVVFFCFELCGGEPTLKFRVTDVLGELIL